MQNLEVKDTVHKIKKTKSEIKNKLKELIAKSGRMKTSTYKTKLMGAKRMRTQ